jgi:hypothetical protein
MKNFLLVLFLGVFSNIIVAQKSSIHILRYNDQFQHLRSDSIPKTGSLKLKMIPMGSPKNRLSIGGEIREQVQYFANQNFGDVPPSFEKVSVTQIWHRVMLHANLDLGKNIRIFGQLNHTQRFFNPNPLIEVDQNTLGLHQLSVDVRLAKTLQLRVGRQEMGYGNNRLLTFREGPNNRLAFDAAVLKYQRKKWRIDALVSSPVVQKEGVGDDISMKEWVSGVYATQIIVPQKLHADYFFLNYTGDRVKYNLTSGKEARQSIGTRIFSQNARFNYELEATTQAGTFNKQKIKAYSIAYDLKYRFQEAQKLTIGLAGHYISGDKNPTDQVLNSFNLLFSKPSFGLAAPIGAVNMVNFNPYLTMSPTKKIQLVTGVYFLSRQSSKDGIYSPGMTQTRPARPDQLFLSNEKEIGQQYVLEAAYTFNAHWAFYLDSGYFRAGSFAKASGAGKNIGYLSAKAAYKF